MKSLKNMNAIDRAKLLHGLFPDKILAFVNDLLRTAKRITADPEKFKDNWQQADLIHAADAWINLARSVEQVIIKYHTKLVENGDWFSHRLFSDDLKDFTVHNLIEYICDEDLDFKLITEGLFEA